MNFPKPKIDKETAMQLWVSEHSDYAKEQVILNNIGIIGFVLKSLNLDNSDEDLWSVGLVGLVKSVNGFDSERGEKFSTYATWVVRGEFLHTFRKKRIIPAFSLDEPCNLGNGEQVSYADVIADDRRFEEEILADIKFNQIIDFLDKTEKKIICLRLAGKTQQQIEKILGISQPKVSRIIKKACEKCKKEFC